MERIPISARLSQVTLRRESGTLDGSVFALLFSEIVRHYRQTSSAKELSAKLEDLGSSVGFKSFAWLCRREVRKARETDHIEILQKLRFKLWPAVFGYEASNLTQVKAGTFNLFDDDPLTDRFVHVNRTTARGFPASFTCASFMAGVARGALRAAGFNAEVSARKDSKSASGRGALITIKFGPRWQVRDLTAQPVVVPPVTAQTAEGAGAPSADGSSGGQEPASGAGAAEPATSASGGSATKSGAAQADASTAPHDSVVGTTSDSAVAADPNAQGSSDAGPGAGRKPEGSSSGQTSAPSEQDAGGVAVGEGGGAS